MSGIGQLLLINVILVGSCGGALMLLCAVMWLATKVLDEDQFGSMLVLVFGVPMAVITPILFCIWLIVWVAGGLK